MNLELICVLNKTSLHLPQEARETNEMRIYILEKINWPESDPSQIPLKCKLQRWRTQRRLQRPYRVIRWIFQHLPKKKGGRDRHISQKFCRGSETLHSITSLPLYFKDYKFLGSEHICSNAILCLQASFSLNKDSSCISSLTYIQKMWIQPGL